MKREEKTGCSRRRVTGLFVKSLAQGAAHAGLIVQHAHASSAVPELACQLGVQAVFCNHDYEPQAIARDERVASALDAAGTVNV